MARPEWEPTPEDRARVREMAAFGYPQVDIAARLGITDKTLTKHCRAELDVARQDLDIAIQAWTVDSILGREGSNIITDDRARVTLAMYYTRTQLKWREPPAEHKHGGEVALVHKVDIAELDGLRERAFNIISQIADRLADPDISEEREAPGVPPDPNPGAA